MLQATSIKPVVDAHSVTIKDAGHSWSYNTKTKSLAVVSRDAGVNLVTGEEYGTRFEVEVDLALLADVERVSGLSGASYSLVLDRFEQLRAFAPDPFTATIEIYQDDITLAHQFMGVHPVWFDAATRMWWVWDFKELRWRLSNEDEVLFKVNQAIHPLRIELKEHTIKSSKANKLLSAIKQASCDPLRRPKPFKKSWIQFKDVIYDLESRREFPVSPEYFAVNPIPWPLAPANEEDYYDCPVIDGLLHDWLVGGEQDESFVDTAYEVMAYCMLADNPLQKWFILTGSGGNGKGSFSHILERFIGVDNAGYTFLKRFAEDKFETVAVYQKLICFIQEARGKILGDSMLLKACTGEDTLPAEFKFVNRFQFKPYAKLFMLSNELPTCEDDSDAWHRRIVMMGFPNKYAPVKDGGVKYTLQVEDSVPEWEYSVLARKLVGVLERLLDKKEFVNEGAIEVRRLKYHYTSNPVEHFIEEKCDWDSDSNIVFGDFYKRLVEFAGEHPTYARISSKKASKLVKEAGFRVDRERFVDWEGRATTRFVIFGLRLKEKEGGDSLSRGAAIMGGLDSFAANPQNQDEEARK